MADPWDIPPFPERGDEDADSIYKMVGKAMSYWEELEYCLSHLYALLAGAPAKFTTMREYGKPRTFVNRALKLRNVAAEFFVQKPDQELEGVFSDLMNRAHGYANRRNEIAHGIVYPLQNLHPPVAQYETLKGEKLEYGLVPPRCTDQKLDDMHRPKYIYTATALMQFALAFHDLSVETVRLRVKIARIV